MKKIFVALCMVAFLAACDDSSSASAGQNDEAVVELSSSSSGKVTEPAEVTSSSSEKAKSSSSDAQSDAKQSSSSEKTGKSSSSSKDIGTSSSSESEKVSSSSVKSESSSSVENSQSSSSDKTSVSSSSESVEPFSSSAGKVNCPALLEGETGWSWDVPKECRFNPDITYGSMTDERDGKAYKTVKIGDQTWMAENLNYADSVKTPSLLKRSWCYRDVAKNCDVTGRFYTWAAAIDSVKLANDVDNPQDCGYGRECGLTGKVQGICPSGWHLPSNEEWNALFTAVGGQSNAGKVLKSQTGWYSNGNGTDAFGFSALPAGYRDDDGYFDGDGVSAFFWSAAEYYSINVYDMGLYFSNEYAFLDYDVKYYGFSVRCLKD